MKAGSILAEWMEFQLIPTCSDKFLYPINISYTSDKNYNFNTLTKLAFLHHLNLPF